MLGVLDVIPESPNDPKIHGEFPVVRDTSAADATQAEIVSVRVAVRCRPLLPRERAERARPCVHVDEVSRAVLVGHSGSDKVRSFAFDHTYGPLSTSGQERVYQECVQGLVEAVLDGYNATVFVYGQTGSGKTFTMGSGEDQLSLPDEELGIVPRALQQLCRGITDSHQAPESFAVRAQLIEIYNEEVRDLLAESPEETAKKIAIREGPEGSIVVAGATETSVRSYEEAMRLFEAATLSRSTGETRMNDRSSRSHAIFSLVVERRIPSSDPLRGAGRVLVGKLHLVDLAGSERNKKTQATGARFKEAISINQGLLALGNVIAALTDDRKRGRTQHVPYRDSKLTRMLQDSLGGNARTCMIACISPADTSLDETLNTLKYASRARTIQNRPQVNAQVMADLEDVYAAAASAQQRDQMRREIGGLQLELLKRMVQDPAANPPPPELYEILGPEAAAVIVEALKNGKVARPSIGGEESLMNPDVSAILPVASTPPPNVARLHAQAEEARRQADELQMQLMKAAADRAMAEERLDRVNTAIAKTLVLLEELEASGALSPELSARIKEALSAARRNPLNPSLLTQSLGALPRPASISRSRISGSFLASRPTSAVNPNANANHPSRLAPASNIEAQQLASTLQEMEQELLRRTEHAQTLEGQLAEAQDDLARDEVIFAEKTREIKELRAHVAHLQEAHEGHVAELEAKVQILQQEIDRLQQVQNRVGASTVAMETVQRSASGPPVLPANLPEDEDEVVVATEESMMAFGDSTAVAVNYPPSSASKHLLHGHHQGHGRPSPSPIPEAADLALQEEFENLLVEKQELEARAAQDRHDFLRFQHQMQRQLDELSSNIQAKEALIEQMAQNEASARELSAQYEGRLREMERELQGREREMEELKRELELLEGDRAKSMEEKKRLRREHEDKVARVNTQLAQLRLKIKEQEALNRDQLEKARDQKRTQEQEQELAKLRQAKETLQKKIREASELHEKEAERKQRELNALRRDQEGHLRRIRELEEESRKKDRILRKREEDLTQAQRKVRELEAEMYGAAGPRAGSGRAPGSQPSSRLTTPAKGTRAQGEETDASVLVPEAVKGGAMATPAGARSKTPVPSAAGKRRSSGGPVDPEWVQSHVQSLLRKHELEARLRSLQQKIRGLEEDREALAEQKSRLDLRRIRAAEALRSELEEIQQALHDLREEALGMSQVAESFQSERAATEVTELEAQQRHLAARREALAGALQSEAFLTTEEEFQLQRVEDALDSLEAELDFLTSERDECQRMVRAAVAAEAEFEARVKDLSPSDTSSLLRKYVGTIAEVREAERAQADRVCELEVQLTEVAKQLEEVRSMARRVELEAVRKTTDLQMKHEKRMSQVLGQMDLVARASVALNQSTAAVAGVSSRPVSSSGRPPVVAVEDSISRSRHLAAELSGTELGQLVEFYREKADILSRDNAYYRSVSRDLKRKIKDVLKAEEVRQSRAQGVSKSVAAAPQHVTIPRDQLRPLSAEQVAERARTMALPASSSTKLPPQKQEHHPARISSTASRAPPPSEAGPELSVLHRMLESLEQSLAAETGPVGLSPIPKPPSRPASGQAGRLSRGIVAEATAMDLGNAINDDAAGPTTPLDTSTASQRQSGKIVVNSLFPGVLAIGESGVVFQSPERGPAPESED